MSHFSAVVDVNLTFDFDLPMDGSFCGILSWYLIILIFSLDVVVKRS